MGAYPWFTRALWLKTSRRAYLYALRLKHPPHEAKDFVQAAILKALDPKKSPWSPGMKPDFASHVCNLLYSAHGNHVQSYAVLKAREPLDPVTNARRPDFRTPEQALSDQEEHDLARTQLEALSERTRKDKLVRLLLDEREGKTSTERARAKGHTLDDIELARERLKRHVEAVVREIGPGQPRGGTVR